MATLTSSPPVNPTPDHRAPGTTLTRRLSALRKATVAQAAAAMVRVAAGLLLLGAGVSTLVYHNVYQTIPPLPPGAERVVWIPQRGLLPETFYGAAALGLGGLLLVGWQLRLVLVLVNLLICLVSSEHLLADPFYNLSTHLLPLLALTLTALAASPAGDPFSVDALLRPGRGAPSARWANGWMVLCLRLFLGSIFLLQGFHSLTGPGPVAFARKLYVVPFASTGLPPALLWVAGLTNPPLQFFGGAALLLGLHTRTAAVAVGLFLLEIIFGHMVADPLEYQGDLQKYGLANFLVVAALLFLVDRGNHLSVDHLRRRPPGAGRRAAAAGWLSGGLLGLLVGAAPVGVRAGNEGAGPVPGATATARAVEAVREGQRLAATSSLDDAWRGVELFKQAIATDPRCAAAYVALAEAYISAPIGYSGPGRRLSSAEAYPQAQLLAKQALALDERLGSAHRVIARCAFYYTYDWELAGAEFLRVTALAPDNAAGHLNLARYFASANRFDEAHAEADRARRLDPPGTREAYRQGQIVEGQILYFQRRFREAVALDRRALAEFPDVAINHFLLGSALVENGEPAEGTVELERFAALTGRNPGGLGALAHAQARAGHPEAARALLAELRTRAETEQVSFYQIAAAHVALGEFPEALDCLERAVKEERANWPTWLRQDARFDPVRTTPRFQRLLTQLWPPPHLRE